MDVTQFPFRPRATTDLPVVALPARLLREKGVREFVAAAKRLRAEGVSARFVLVGGVDMGNPSAVSEAELTDWTNQGLVEWWGHSNDMCATYNDCDVVVLPSYREGLPKALLEAAAMGRPLVATDVPGCREVVRHEQNGLLVPLLDEQALAQAMHRLITDAGLRQQFAAAGRRMVEAEWSAEIISGQYCDLYERLQRRSR